MCGAVLVLGGCGNSGNDGGSNTGGVGGLGGSSGVGGLAAGGAIAGGAGAGGASAGGANAGGSNTAGNGGMCATIVTDPKFASNYCNNVADRCYAEANNTAIIAASGQCATGDCLAQAIDLGSGTEKPEDYACFADCIPKKLMAMTGGSISTDCTRCPAMVSACGSRNCLALCISNAADPACVECLCQSHPAELNNAGGNCIMDVYANCAGYLPTPQQVGCAK